jgi:hypothetical protein
MALPAHHDHWIHEEAAMAAITFNTAQRAAGRLETAPFRPLDASIVSDAIPAFFIGRNRDGFWVARDAKGRIGGLFLLKASAVSFARAQSRLRGCATIFPTDRFELDLKNDGNPLIPLLRPLMRLALHLQQRALAGVGQITAAIERCRKA